MNPRDPSTADPAGASPDYRRAQALVAQLQAQAQAQAQAQPASPAEVDRIETHISWLLLVGPHAYKFKKPLRLDILDFSTLALRRAACEQELRINRRTAPSLYLGLVAVVGTPQAPRLVPLAEADDPAAPQPVLEVAVRMQRFAQSALLSELSRHDQLLPRHIDALALCVARFHAAAEVAPADGAWGRPDTVADAMAGNFAPLHALIDPPAFAQPDLKAQLQAVDDWRLREGLRLAPEFAQRLADGQVRECHGDLHLANLVLIDGAPQLFDAIEFNPALRWIDVMADLAFLVMDLQARGHTALAWRFLNESLEHTGDHAGLRVLRYYSVYRAMVRARVAALRLAQQAGEACDASLRDMARYLRLAQTLTRPGERVLWLTCGVSGSGKSHHSQSLIEARGIVRVKADVERKRLFGLDRHARSAGRLAGGIYTAEASRRTYARLAEVARQVLDAGLPVLVDATFLKRAHREPFYALARDCGARCIVLAFDAPEAVLRERVRLRARSGQDASEADEAVLTRQLAEREPLDADERLQAVGVDSRGPVDWGRLLSTAG